MTTKAFILIFIYLALSSCDNLNTQDKAKEETPNALQDKNFSSEIVSKRSYDDVVEILYKELLDKDKNLRQLEHDIDALNSSKNDTTELFNNFNIKNESYYSSVNRHIDQINDTLLKERIKVVITNSLTNYNSLIAKHKALLKAIEAKNTTISDLHTVLKITKTIPLINKYQKQSLPTTKSLEGYINEQNKAIKFADTLTKK